MKEKYIIFRAETLPNIFSAYNTINMNVQVSLYFISLDSRVKIESRELPVMIEFKHKCEINLCFLSHWQLETL